MGAVPGITAQSGYIARLEPDGAAIDYATYFGGRWQGRDGERVGDLFVTDDGRAYIVGSTGAVEFPTTPNAQQMSVRGDIDAFLVQFGSMSAESYGQGVGDWQGVEPVLSAGGGLAPGDVLKLRVRDGYGGAVGALLLGASGRANVNLPYLGITLLVAQPMFLTIVLNGSPGLSQYGTLDLNIGVPASGALTGVAFNAQVGLLAGSQWTTSRGIKWLFE